MSAITLSPVPEELLYQAGHRRLRFVTSRRLLVTVSACFRQVCKRRPFAMRIAIFRKTKSRVLQAERTSFETVTTAVQHAPRTARSFHHHLHGTSAGLDHVDARAGHGYHRALAAVARADQCAREAVDGHAPCSVAHNDIAALNAYVHASVNLNSCDARGGSSLIRRCKVAY